MQEVKKMGYFILLSVLVSIGIVSMVIGAYVMAKRRGKQEEYNTLVLPVILVMVPVIVTGLISYAQTKANYLQIAADILNRDPPKEAEEINIRKWAVTLIKEYSPVEIDEATERAMIYGEAHIQEAPDGMQSEGTVK